MELVIPTVEHRHLAMEFRQEHIDCGEPHINGSWGFQRKEYEDYEKWLNDIENLKNGRGNNPNINVPATTYFAFMDNKIVGTIQIRHYLNDYLLKNGGHIGYSIRPSERCKGYGTRMLALALEKCRYLGIGKALITCDKSNIASAKTAIRNGGALENEVIEENGNIIQRYWITLKMEINRRKTPIIVVTGYLTAGKSTFARRLSDELNIPYLIKDTFKIALCANIELSDRAEKSRFSAVTFDAMMYVTERLIETGCPAVIEGNFVPRGVKKIDEAGVIKALLEKHNCQSLTFKFIGDTHVLHKRFVERENLPERGQANTMGYEISHDEFNLWCHNLDAFDVGGEIVEIDGTNFDTVDFNKHIETARDFLGRF